MEAFVKSISTYRTIKKATAISSALVVDSLDADTSTVTVKGTEINRGDTGNWLIVDGMVFYISQVKPQKDRTALTLLSPLEAFSRPLELPVVGGRQTVGSFAAGLLQQHWVDCEDDAYAMRYLTVITGDSAPYVEPELDNAGCFKLNEYLRLMRKSYRVHARFQDAGDTLSCIITTAPVREKRIPFDDGASQIQSVDYSSSGTAKLTVLCDVDTGDKDADGEAILERQRYIWYLAEDGTVSQAVPSRRASGIWSTITVKKLEEMPAKVVETFAKNKSNHKLEFWSTRDLQVQDDCTFMVYGELLQSYISYKRKSSEDRRFYYKSGELAVTAAEKLRGVTK